MTLIGINDCVLPARLCQILEDELAQLKLIAIPALYNLIRKQKSEIQEQEEIIESLTQGIARLSDELDDARKRVSPLFDIDRASSISPSPFSVFDDDF